jgi:DNA-binding transcriptional LysR family regulator
VELRHIEHFVAIAEESSFTQAARRLHLSQSALSVSIRALERDLGARLFERTSHEVALSDAGRTLLLEARRILGDVATRSPRTPASRLEWPVRHRRGSPWRRC